MKNSLKVGVILTYVTIAVQFITSLLYTPFMLSAMGQQQYGLYNMGASVIGYLSLAELGFGNAVVRYASRYRGKGDREKESSLYGLFQYIYLILATVVLLGGGLLSIFSDRFFTVSTGLDGYRQLKLIMAILTVNLAMGFATVVFSSIITAYERYTFAKITNIVYLLMKSLVMIPLLLYGYKAVAMSLVTMLLTAALNVGNILYVKYALKIKFDMRKSHIDFSILKEIVSFSGLVFLVSLAGTLTNSTDQVILGITSGEMVVAIYSVASTVIGYAQQFPGAVSSVWYPRINMELAQGKPVRELSDRMISVGRLQTYILILVYGGFVVFGQEFIHLWAGKEYGQAYWIVLVILLPWSVPNIQSMGVQIIQATDKFAFKAKMDVLCAVVNVICSIPAAIYFGAVGCAACTGISIIVTKGFIMNWYYDKRMDLDIKRFWREICKILCWLIPLCIVAYVANACVKAETWGVLIVKISIFSALYLLLTISMVMNASEKEMIFGMLKRFALRRKNEHN